jgi:molybdopterin-guanine dinucleotide biosynthesis protein B
MILGIYGESKTGKTTLISRLIGELKKKGFNVGSVKNIHQSNFTIDSEGKDTWEHTHAGSQVVVARSKDEVAFLVNHSMPPSEVMAIVENIAELDIVLVEGYWEDDSPKIVLGDMDQKPNTVIDYKDIFEEVLEFAIDNIEEEKVLKQLPGLDCGKCGKDFCKQLAKAIRADENKFEDCYYYSEKKISVSVDGKEIPMGKFAKDMVAGTVAGMISSLKGVDGGKDIKIEIKA